MSKVLGKKELTALAARAEVAFRDAKEDCAWFINNYAHIEDKDVAGIKIPFRLWQKSPDCPYDNQDTVLKKILTKRRLIMLKARQLGFTWLVIAYSVWRMISTPGYTVSVVSRSENEAKEFVRRVSFMLRNLPKWMIRAEKGVNPAWNGLVYTTGVLDIVIKHPGEEPAGLKGHAAGPDTVRSFTDSLLVFDEWAFHKAAHDIFQSAYAAINRPTGGQFIGLSTGRRGTLFEEQWNRSVQGDYIFDTAFAPWYADPRRDKHWYANTKDVLGHRMTAEYPTNPEEAFAPGEGAFFDSWNLAVHVPFEKGWYPPADWRLIRSYDGGYNRACCKWYAVSPEGLIVCYREYYPEKTIDPIQAETIRMLSRDPKGAPEEIAYTVADTSCWTPGQEKGETTAKIFIDHGLGPMVQAKKDRVNGWRRLQQYLKPFNDIVGLDEEHEPVTEEVARLRFTKSCANSIRTYPSVEINKNNPNDIALGQEDHAQDCDRYLVMSMPRPKVGEKEKARIRERRRQLGRPLSKYTGY